MYKLLHNSLLVAIKLGQMGETIDNYQQLVDELDATGDYLTTLKWNDISDRSRRTWVGMFLDSSSHTPMTLRDGNRPVYWSS